jgi:hypothetical protein
LLTLPLPVHIAHPSFTLFTSSITQSHYVFTTIAHASFTCSHSASQRPTGHTDVHSHSAPATATLKSDYVFTYIIRPFKMQRDTFIFFFWGDKARKKQKAKLVWLLHRRQLYVLRLI